MKDIFDFSTDGKTLLSIKDKKVMCVSIPDGVTEIGESAFSWCRSLQSIDIPNSVTRI